MAEVTEHAREGRREIRLAAAAPQPRRRAAHAFADVLCAVDGTRPSFAAVEQAAQLAGPQGHLTLLAVTAPRGAGRFRSASLGCLRARRVIERASEIAHRRAVPFTPVVDPGGPPAKAIAERAADHDLLAIGAPMHSSFGSFGGSAAVERMSTIVTPLLLARSISGRPVAEAIVVASDGSEGSDALVGLAGALAGESCRRIVLVHAQGSESNAHPHRVLAEKALLEHACGDRARTTIEPSNAWELIEQVVDAQDATLAVLGSRRASAVGGMLGSVSRRAVRTLGCSVLVIAPERLRSDLSA